MALSWVISTGFVILQDPSTKLDKLVMSEIALGIIHFPRTDLKPWLLGMPVVEVIDRR